MAKTGNTIATFLIGAAVGAAVGYILATDKDTRKEGMEKLKGRFNDIKTKFAKKAEDVEHDIYHA